MREWLPFSGRDGEGDKYEDLCLVESSTGQILGVVQLPKAQEYWFGVEIYIPHTSCGERFIDLEPAKRFCEDVVGPALEEWECQKINAADWRQETLKKHKRKVRRASKVKGVPC